MLAAILIDFHPDFTVIFQYVLAVAVVFEVVGTVAQHVLYDASEDSIGDSFEGIDQIKLQLVTDGGKAPQGESNNDTRNAIPRTDRPIRC